MALVSAWPMCSEPVTLGGGITITNGGLSAGRAGEERAQLEQNSTTGAEAVADSHASCMHQLTSGYGHGNRVVMACACWTHEHGWNIISHACWTHEHG